MHVLITTPSFPPAIGGVAQVCGRQAAYLATRGHRVTVITGGGTGDESGFGKTAPDGLNVIRLPVKTARFPAYAAGDALGLRQRQARASYQDLLLRCPADVMLSHCWQAWNTDWAHDIGARLRIPFCLFSHGTSVNDTSGRTGWLRWVRWRSYAIARMPRTMRRLSLLIALSAQADNNRFFDVHLARKMGVLTATVPNCADPALEGTVPSQPPEVSTSFMALSVGQYSDAKNPRQVLESFLRQAPAGWTLVLCGSHRTPYLDVLERRYALARRAGPTPPVEFLTDLSGDHLRGLYKRADLFLSHSRTECQPLVLIDAMAAGVPFLSSDVGCVRSLPGGLAAGTVDEFDSRAATLMRDAKLRAELSIAGLKAYEETYNCPSTLRRLEELLLEAVAPALGRQHA